ncbi:CCA tRNA nucleotidyltransferase 1, mitochondrial-like [Octopus vulgaris]|uniref:CCA tRNA nucleotidyltransferase 1, mitochondrial-like n=1 Tax=Octopus vulgaris TaxID=6645 RepID=A0AA36FAB5_OCTVU|nr:CCA tRNA nucleotidyltransferase 1, mitochondrial-like [Octopus vulgaris]
MTELLSKIDSPEFHALFTPQLEILIKVFKKHNHMLRITGGAVRDLLMWIGPTDIDFATTASPEEMKIIFTEEGIRMINLNGEKHKTVTVRINDKENFEISTLRTDSAIVKGAATQELDSYWQQDANKRDLTINAMFLDFDGVLYDYVNGQENLKSKVVKFVDNPEDRIQEDYLRILRYFRFWGKIASSSSQHNPDTLLVIKNNAHGLSNVSGERIWQELKRIVNGPLTADMMSTMFHLGVLSYIGLPKTSNITEFQNVCDNCQQLSPSPITLITALLETNKELLNFQSRVKISTDELRQGTFIIQQRNKLNATDDTISYCQQLLMDRKEHNIKSYIKELLKYNGKHEVLKNFDHWDPPKFPVSGYDLLARNIPKGSLFQKIISKLKCIWKESNYSMKKDDLLDMVEQILENLK